MRNNKYYIIDYMILYNEKYYYIEEVELIAEVASGNEWYFTLIDQNGKEYRKQIEEIYGIQDIEYLKQIVQKENTKANKNLNRRKKHNANRRK